MQELIVPKALKKGDTIALISISGGRAGDADMLYRYEIGKKRLEEIWGLNVIITPNALAGSVFLYEHPEARANDLKWALENENVSGIICMMGGDDSYRVLPYIDIAIIRNNPKVFMGYSDITSWMTVFAKAGVRAYYGPNLLTPIAQPFVLDEYTKNAITKCLFSTEVIGEISACKEYTNIEWKNVTRSGVRWYPNSGYKLIQGSGIARGRIFGGTVGALQQIMGTEYFPSADFFKNCIIALELGIPYKGSLAVLHQLRALDAAGVFKEAAGVIIGQIKEEEELILTKFLKYEAKKEDIPVLANVDFVHRTPMTVLPIGAMTEIDCDNITLKILEAGVRD